MRYNVKEKCAADLSIAYQIGENSMARQVTANAKYKDDSDYMGGYQHGRKYRISGQNNSNYFRSSAISVNFCFSE